MLATAHPWHAWRDCHSAHAGSSDRNAGYSGGVARGINGGTRRVPLRASKRRQKRTTKISHGRVYARPFIKPMSDGWVGLARSWRVVLHQFTGKPAITPLTTTAAMIRAPWPCQNGKPCKRSRNISMKFCRALAIIEHTGNPASAGAGPAAARSGIRIPAGAATSHSRHPSGGPHLGSHGEAGADAMARKETRKASSEDPIAEYTARWSRKK